ncbi:MAG TPA: ComF family protein [Cellvibrio sp.]|nr:ComF family protein [Cellvibrio sp.]
MKLLRDLSRYSCHAFVQALSLCGNYLLPTQCLLCGCTLSGQLLCEGCRADLPWIKADQPHCRQCALALTTEAEFCGQCLRQPPAFSRSYIAFAYRHPLDNLIHRFKYRRTLASGKLLGQLFSDYIQKCSTAADWHRPDLLIPTPMHWTRRWQRGFNQADQLGQYLARATGIPLANRLVQRRERTQAQKALTRRERQKNLRNAFYLAPAQREKIRGKCIALVDDVVTTTATMRELSQFLNKAGAGEIQVWALARTMNE